MEQNKHTFGKTFGLLLSCQPTRVDDTHGQTSPVFFNTPINQNSPERIVVKIPFLCIGGIS